MSSYFGLVKKSLVKNFGLTASQFEKLQSQLIEGNDELFEHLFLNHFESCRAYLIYNLQVSPEDAYDAAMEALLKMRVGIIRGNIKYGNLRFLFTLMAKQQYLKSIPPTPTIPLESISNIQSEEPSLPDAIFQQLAINWKSLSESCRALLFSIYYQQQKISALAKDSGQNPATLRKQKQRCIEHIRSSFLKQKSE